MHTSFRFNVIRTDVVHYNNGEVGKYINHDIALSANDIRKVLQALTDTNQTHINDDLIGKLADILS
jgi:hypothetical protein